jgi:hypothetical protein
METPTDVLDGAFDRLGRWGFDDPDGYVNHGPMVCEALDALGRPDEVDSWSRLDTGTPPATPVEPRGFEPTEALGDATRAGEWIGVFERRVADDGWALVLDEWLPHLQPGLGSVLFHGAIRCAHATRAIESADTAARRAEHARALGDWAALFSRSYPPDDTAVRRADDTGVAVVRAAADAAHRYLARPSIVHLHGVTAAMAVSILVRHTDEVTAATALAHLRAEHAALYAGTEPTVDVDTPDIDQATFVDAAIASGDAHAVKLVEATRRGFAATGDPVFLAAAERVTRRGRRTLAQRDLPSNDESTASG